MSTVFYIVEIDTSEMYQGSITKSVHRTLEDAVDHYLSVSNGRACIVAYDASDKSKRILQDATGRKYVKGSPYYAFPHVPHVSKIDGKEIETT